MNFRISLANNSSSLQTQLHYVATVFRPTFR